MPNSVLYAQRVTGDFFNLDRSPFNAMLADDVKVKIKATIGPDKKVHTQELIGKEAVAASFAQRHFDITQDVEIRQLKYTPIKKHRVAVAFKTIETKTEGEQSVKYRYNGTYILRFDDKGMVTKIELENKRRVCKPKSETV